jgi:hypothetical protein
MGPITPLSRAELKIHDIIIIFNEALNNSSMNYQNTNKISAILSCSSFSMAYQPLKMTTHPCVAETLFNSEFP